jgi:hypothetical protein
MIGNLLREGVHILTRLILAVVAAALLLVASSGHCIVIEGEDFVASQDLGGIPIAWTYCSGASGGKALDGLDIQGEWIELVLDTPDAGSFTDSLRSAGLLDEESNLRSTVVNGGPGGTDLMSSFHTVGLGIG